MHKTETTKSLLPFNWVLPFPNSLFTENQSVCVIPSSVSAHLGGSQNPSQSEVQEVSWKGSQGSLPGAPCHTPSVGTVWLSKTKIPLSCKVSHSLQHLPSTDHNNQSLISPAPWKGLTVSPGLHLLLPWACHLHPWKVLQIKSPALLRYKLQPLYSAINVCLRWKVAKNSSQCWLHIERAKMVLLDWSPQSHGN